VWEERPCPPYGATFICPSANCATLIVGVRDGATFDRSRRVATLIGSADGATLIGSAYGSTFVCSADGRNVDRLLRRARLIWLRRRAQRDRLRRPRHVDSGAARQRNVDRTCRPKVSRRPAFNCPAQYGEGPGVPGTINSRDAGGTCRLAGRRGPVSACGRSGAIVWREWGSPRVASVVCGSSAWSAGRGAIEISLAGRGLRRRL